MVIIHHTVKRLTKRRERSEARTGIEPVHGGFVPEIADFFVMRHTPFHWMHGGESNPCMRVLQTPALPLRHRAI